MINHIYCYEIKNQKIVKNTSKNKYKTFFDLISQYYNDIVVMTVGTFTEYEHMTEGGNCRYENRQSSEVSSENDITYDIT